MGTIIKCIVRPDYAKFKLAGNAIYITRQTLSRDRLRSILADLDFPNLIALFAPRPEGNAHPWQANKKFKSRTNSFNYKAIGYFKL